MHVHLGALFVLNVGLAMIVWNFFVRTLAACLVHSDNNVLRSIGEALAYTN